MPLSLYSALSRKYGHPPDAVSRREALRAMLAASAGLLVSDRIAFGQPRSVGKRVIVIGAGVRGR